MAGSSAVLPAVGGELHGQRQGERLLLAKLEEQVHQSAPGLSAPQSTTIRCQFNRTQTNRIRLRKEDERAQSMTWVHNVRQAYVLRKKCDVAYRCKMHAHSKVTMNKFKKHI